MGNVREQARVFNARSPDFHAAMHLEFAIRRVSTRLPVPAAAVTTALCRAGEPYHTYGKDGPPGFVSYPPAPPRLPQNHHSSPPPAFRIASRNVSADICQAVQPALQLGDPFFRSGEFFTKDNDLRIRSHRHWYWKIRVHRKVGQTMPKPLRVSK